MQHLHVACQLELISNAAVATDPVPNTQGHAGMTFQQTTSRIAKPIDEESAARDDSHSDVNASRSIVRILARML